MGTFQAVVAALILAAQAPAAVGADEAHLRPAVARVGVPFIENTGQASPEVRFLARTFGGALLVSGRGELVLSLPAGQDSREPVVLRESLRGGTARGTSRSPPRWGPSSRSASPSRRPGRRTRTTSPSASSGSPSSSPPRAPARG